MEQPQDRDPLPHRYVCAACLDPKLGKPGQVVCEGCADLGYDENGDLAEGGDA